MENQIVAKDRETWRKWLSENHDKLSEIYLVYFKKNSGIDSITYEESVQEALCYGWIDGKLKSIDDEKYIRRFTPRKEISNWSPSNIKRVEKMISLGKMTEFGQIHIDRAKERGIWEKKNVNKAHDIPKILLIELKKNKQAWNNFQNFAPGYRRDYIRYILDAKRETTKLKRIALVVQRSLDNEPPGMM